MISGVYEIYNKLNGKRYIGSALNLELRKANHFSLLRKHKHHSIHLQRAWDKHGEGLFEFRIIHYVSPILLILVEQFYIDSFDFKIDLYNILPTAGSSFGIKRTDEYKRELSKSLRGRKMPPHTSETRLKLSLAHKGKVLSSKHKLAISTTQKGAKKPPRTPDHNKNNALARQKCSSTEADQIKCLRAQGISFAKIGAALNKSPDVVRRYALDLNKYLPK